MARARCVPRHDRELVGQAFDLAALLPAVAGHPVYEDERWPFARSLISDAESFDLKLVIPSPSAGAASRSLTPSECDPARLAEDTWSVVVVEGGAALDGP